MSFTGLDGETLDYFDHPYNAAGTNERTVEVPIALAWIARQRGVGLEVGNVLRHYVEATWKCVDVAECWPGVTNVDICDFRPRGRFDWVVSISTIEHIGWDGRAPGEEPDPEKALRAIEHIRENVLAPGGKLLLSFPTDAHPRLDEAVADGTLEATSSVFLVRHGPPHRGRSEWKVEPFRSIPRSPEAWSASGVWIGELS